jgi:hypothetical protein
VVGVRQEVQWYLAEALANVRAMKDIPQIEQRSDVVMASFSSGLAALRYVNELTDDEEQDWADRMRLALGITANRIAVRIADDGEPPAVMPAEPRNVPFPRFVRSIPGPDAEYDLYGGLLRIVAVEIYDTMVNVRWRAAPEPDVFAAFPDEPAQLAHDVEGTDAWAAEELKKKAEKRFRTFRLYNFGLTDDVGTGYHSTGGGRGSHGNGTTGEVNFSPAPPANASVLTITLLDVEVEIPL